MSFGAPQSGFNFGAPAATTAAPSGFGLGTPQQQQSSFSFSTPTATVQPQPQATGLSFGGQATAQPSALSFGLSAAPTNTVAPTVSLVTSTATQAQASGFSFGQPAAVTTSVAASAPLSFGFSTPTQAQSNAGISFGQPAQPSGGISFSQPAQTTASTGAPAMSFGFPAATQTAAAPSLTLNPLSTTTTASTGLSFGQPASSQAPTLFGATQQQPSLLGSLTTQNPAPIATIAPISSVPQNLGLGGVDINTTQPKAAEGKSESTKVKETQVPKEIIQTVEDFKAYVKQQKTLSSDIIRTTDRKLKSVTDEIQRLNCNVQEVSNNVDNNKLAIKLLRSDTSKVIQHSDMAQRTHETPSGLQFENIMPQIYFNELVHKYENDLLTLKHQVELTEKHLQSLSNPQNFSAQDLKRGLQQIHESFIALAGRLQETHTKVDTQKEQYLNLRKFILRDTTNVFEIEQEKDAATSNTSKVQYGPNPFTSSMLGGGLNLSNQSAAAKQWSAQQQPQQQPNNSFFGASSFAFKK